VLLGDDDREQLFEALKQHAAAGRIGIEELERRVAAIGMAQTREQAAQLMADLPPVQGERQDERRPRWGRGHGEADAPAADWQPTGERFRDPKSGQIMRVWVDTTGARHYVVDE
jgi:uncharacterized protein DUF1707